MEINDTKRNELEKIEKLNEDEVITLIPMILFLSIICIIGLPGNGLVCYIYSTKYRVSSSQWFILFLAIADLVMCVVILPSEIGTSLYQYNFTNGAACKITVYLFAWTMLTLGFTLVVVSVDRYRKVCKPLGWQIDFKKARFLTICGIITGCLIALPVLGAYGIHRYELNDYNVTVSECSFKQTTEGSSFAFYFVLFGIVLFICALTTICVLYCFIGKYIKHHIHKQQARRQVSLSQSMAHTRKATSIMFLISLAFVLSYLPMLCLLMVRSIDHEFELTLTGAGRAAYKFSLRSYLLNVSINPFIYGLSDTIFRENCKDVLYKIYFTLKCKT